MTCFRRNGNQGSIIHPGAFRRRKKQHAVWRAIKDALPPFSISCFRPRWTTVYLFCLCLPEPAPNIRGQSKSYTAHLTPQRSSPWLPQASLLLGRPACTHCNTLHFEAVGQIFPKRVAHRSQYIPHASAGSSCMQSLSCCPTACANLHSACAFHITAKQEKLPTCPRRLSPCAHPVVMEASVQTVTGQMLVNYVHVQ